MFFHFDKYYHDMICDREATNCSCFLDNRNITFSSFWWCAIYKELWKMMFICYDACGDHKGGRIVENVGSCHPTLFIKSAKVVGNYSFM